MSRRILDAAAAVLALFATLAVIGGAVTLQATRPLAPVASAATPQPASTVTPARDPVEIDPEHSYARWRTETPRTLVTPDAFFDALLRQAWPRDDASALTLAALTCEAPVHDTDGTPILIDLGKTITDSDGYPTIGPGIHLIAHPGIELRHDLTTLDGTAAAVTEIRDEAVRYHRAPLSPWSCVGRTR